jgi:hypothetical protein
MLLDMFSPPSLAVPPALTADSEQNLQMTTHGDTKAPHALNVAGKGIPRQPAAISATSNSIRSVRAAIGK